MIAYTVSTHFSNRLEGIFYDADEARAFQLFKLKQFYQMPDATEEELLAKNAEYGFSKVLQILDAY